MTKRGGQSPKRLGGCTDFGKQKSSQDRSNLSGRVRTRDETENEPTNEPDGLEESHRMKVRRLEGKEQNGSSTSDTPSSDVTGSGTPDQRDYTPPLRSSSVASVSNNPSLSDGGKEVARDLSEELDGEGEILFVMKPEVSTTLKHLQEMSKENPELEVGLEMFRSAFKFLKTILLVKELTKDVEPSSSS